MFLDSAFGDLSPQKKSDTFGALQAAASSQGFQGDIAAVWEDAQGRTRFMAQPQQHPFFQLMNYGQLQAQVNGAIEFGI